VGVVKLVKKITKLGLAESKDIVDSTPSIIIGDVSASEAEKFKIAFEELGAEIILR